MPNEVLTKEQVTQELTAIFRQVFDDPALVVHDALTANDVVEWDSLNHINLVIAVEKHFGIKFTTAQIAGVSNVGEFIGAILEKTKARA
jgi:acyl carrier protein